MFWQIALWILCGWLLCGMVGAWLNWRIASERHKIVEALMTLRKETYCATGVALSIKINESVKHIGFDEDEALTGSETLQHAPFICISVIHKLIAMAYTLCGPWSLFLAARDHRKLRVLRQAHKDFVCLVPKIVAQRRQA